MKGISDLQWRGLSLTCNFHNLKILMHKKVLKRGLLYLVIEGTLSITDRVRTPDSRIGRSCSTVVAVLQVKEYSAVVKVAFQSARSPRT